MVGRLVLKFVPWWVFALMALAMAPLLMTVVQDEVSRRAAFQVLMAAEAPPPQPLGSAPVKGPEDQELNITARWPSEAPMVEFHRDGINYAYTALQPVSGSGPLLALSFEAYRMKAVEAFLEANTDEAGLITLGGLRQSFPTRRAEIAGDMAARGITTPFIIIEPHLGERQKALESKLKSSWLVMGIMVVFEIALLGAAAVKFRQWRRRRAGKRLALPRQVVRKASKVSSPAQGATANAQAPVKAAQKARSDPFADSPIQTRKRWFG